MVFIACFFVLFQLMRAWTLQELQRSKYLLLIAQKSFVMQFIGKDRVWQSRQIMQCRSHKRMQGGWRWVAKCGNGFERHRQWLWCENHKEIWQCNRRHGPLKYVNVSFECIPPQVIHKLVYVMCRIEVFQSILSFKERKNAWWCCVFIQIMMHWAGKIWDFI